MSETARRDANLAARLAAAIRDMMQGVHAVPMWSREARLLAVLRQVVQDAER